MNLEVNIRLHKEEHIFYHSSNKVKVNKSRRFRLTGYVTRMGDINVKGKMIKHILK